MRVRIIVLRRRRLIRFGLLVFLLALALVPWSLPGSGFREDEGGRATTAPPGPSGTVGAISSKAPVVIDPGHGGIDGGSYYGEILEKDINLDLAKRVVGILRRRGIPVELTREEDMHLSLRHHRIDIGNRIDIALSSGAWALISLHVNYAEVEYAKGTLILYQEWSAESRRIGEIIQAELKALQPDKKNDIDPEGELYMFTESPIPTVIVEVGFLSNPEDRELLMKDEFREKMAGTLARGIEKARKEFLLREDTGAPEPRSRNPLRRFRPKLPWQP